MPLVLHLEGRVCGVDTFDHLALLTAQDDQVGPIPGGALNLFEHLLRDAEEGQDLLTQVRTGAAVAQQGVRHVDDQATHRVEDHESSEVAVVAAPQQFDASRRAVGGRDLVRLVACQLDDPREDDLDLPPGRIGRTGDGREGSEVLPGVVAVVDDVWCLRQKWLVVGVRCGSRDGHSHPSYWASLTADAGT